MDTHLSGLLRNRFTLALTLLIGVAAGIILFFQSALPAHAGTSCGQAVCYVDSTVRAESDWATQPYVGSDGSSSSPGSGASPDYMTTYTACSSWLPVGGGYSTGSYPKTGMTCNFADGGSSGGGQGVVRFACPPQGDRSSNGRVTYFIRQILADGGTRWVYARYRCLYPTDAYFLPTTARGKIYTGGQGDFYQTMDGNVAQQATRAGYRTATSGYVDRGVDLNSPEHWAGSWQPAFTAQTGTTAAGTPLYGFYRLLWVLDYRMCVKTSWPAWMNQAAVYDCAERGQDTFVNPYTYSCDANPPLQAGIRWDALFNPQDCVPSWQCVLTSQTLVGGHTEPVTAMRNGQPLEVRNANPSVNVYDPARIRNVGQWKAFRTIDPGSTPESTYVKPSWKWDRWESFTPTSTISFNWASESAAQAFSWTTRYRFSAEFLVPRQDSVAGGVTYVWVWDTADCLQSTSPDVLVMRATNQ